MFLSSAEVPTFSWNFGGISMRDSTRTTWFNDATVGGSRCFEAISADAASSAEGGQGKGPLYSS
jgi:hypothetical protein